MGELPLVGGQADSLKLCSQLLNGLIQTTLGLVFRFAKVLEIFFGEVNFFDGISVIVAEEPDGIAHGVGLVFDGGDLPL